jgi:DNA repair protein RadC
MANLTLSPNPYDLIDHAVITGEDQEQSYVLRVKDLPEDQKPREKLLKLGAQSLTVPELVAVLWGVGTKKEEVMSMAQRLVTQYGEKALAAETNPQKLAEVLDIPLVKASQIVAGFEIGRRFYAVKGGRAVFIRNARQAYQYLRTMTYSNKEQLRGLYLNSRYEVVHDEVISVGTLTSNLVHAREVFQPAIQHGAIAVIIAHNHPSGTITPTEADINVTKQLIQAGKVLGIDLLDHLVIANNSFVSILECINE